MPVRIIHLVGDSKFGGASLSILGLARHWQSLNWEVEILTTDPELANLARRCGVGVVPIEVIWRQVRPLRDLLGLWRLYRFLASRKYTVVHTHTTKAGFVGRLAALLARTPIVIHTAHGFAFHEQSPWWKIALYTALDRLASVACQRVIAVSRFHGEWGKRLGIAANDKIEAIPNGVPGTRFVSAQEREAVRERWGLGPEGVAILTPGRLATEKGLEDLIDAARLLSQDPQLVFRIAIAGDGPLRRNLEDRARRHGVAGYVLFLGFQQDVTPFLMAADIVVLPSWREGLSIALLEALAAGRPIVATEIGSTREVAADGGLLLVPPGTPGALADGIRRLASDAELRVTLGQRAQQTYFEHYTQEQMLSRYHRVYMNLLEEDRHARTLPALLPSVHWGG